MEVLNDVFINSISKIVDNEIDLHKALELISKKISEEFDIEEKYYRKGLVKIFEQVYYIKQVYNDDIKNDDIINSSITSLDILMTRAIERKHEKNIAKELNKSKEFLKNFSNELIEKYQQVELFNEDDCFVWKCQLDDEVSGFCTLEALYNDKMYWHLTFNILIGDVSCLSTSDLLKLFEIQSLMFRYYFTVQVSDDGDGNKMNFLFITYKCGRDVYKFGESDSIFNNMLKIVNDLLPETILEKF